MIKNYITIAAALLTIQAFAQDLPRPSQGAEVEQMVGLTEIEIAYSRPNVNGRVIWGELVPYDKVWRTGANEATTITFSTDVNVNGTEVAAGEYGLYTIPGKDEWTIVLSSDNDLWGAGGYTADNDVLRFTAKPMANKFTETLTIGFSIVKHDMCMVDISWDELIVSFPINADSKEQAVANIEKEISAVENPFRVYNSSARYFVDNNMELEKALEYAEKSVAGKAQFWNVYTLSLAQAANGKYKEAIASAEQSKELAVEADYPPYIKMNDDNIARWKTMK